MFNKKNTADRIDDNSFVTNNGKTAMLSTSTSLNNRIKTIAAAIAITATALFAAAMPVSADAVPASGFTPDGVNFIPAAGSDAQVLSYLNGGNFSPDGISNLQDAGQTAPVIAMWTPDGVNQVEQIDSPAFARTQVLAYLNGGNFSPDGVSIVQNAGQVMSIDTLAFLYAEITDASSVG